MSETVQVNGEGWARIISGKKPASFVHKLARDPTCGSRAVLTGRNTEFNRLVDALRHLDDSQLLSALIMAKWIYQAAQPGYQQRKNTRRLKACELVVGERFRSDLCDGQA